MWLGQTHSNWVFPEYWDCKCKCFCAIRVQHRVGDKTERPMQKNVTISRIYKQAQISCHNEQTKINWKILEILTLKKLEFKRCWIQHWITVRLHFCVLHINFADWCTSEYFAVTFRLPCQETMSSIPLVLKVGQLVVVTFKFYAILLNK